MSTASGTAVAGVLVSLGGRSTLDSARWLLFGFAALCALGVFTARAADRPSRTGRPAEAAGRGPVTRSR
ncbi:hypothetical protein [Streptomyces sp. NPDC058773]|uniref:hypothetical protein n=1 Tax=Streptomyces sp. NPDC058773 TaxID=3346632 RepID=UPI0036AE20EC